MSDFPKNCTTTVVPGLRYKEASVAIEWLCRAFGFEKHVVYLNDDGTVAHAQLKFGNGMIMLSTAGDTEFGRFSISPAETGGRNMQSSYLVVNDADAVYASVKAAGAEIAIEIKDESYGGRGFTCRDPEGYLWSVGTYNPWE